MPITITPGSPLNWVGAGLPFLAQSSVIGPMPTDTKWVITFSFDSEMQQPIHKETIPWTGNPQMIYPHTNGTPVPLSAPFAVQNQTQVYTTVELQEPTGIVDSGQIQTPWAAYEGQSEQIWRVAQQQQEQGAFTETDRSTLQTTQQDAAQMVTNWTQYEQVTLPSLQDVLNNITAGITSTITGAAGAVSKTIGQLFSGHTVDFLINHQQGTVCAPDTLDLLLTGGTFWGIQLTCTSFADWYTWTGPGDSYATESLGTLIIERGGSIVARIGLHTTSHTVYPLPGYSATPITLELPTVPGDYHVVLTPAAETCWMLETLGNP